MQKRKLNIEFVRIFAIIMTIMIHVSNVYVRGYEEISKPHFFVSVVYNSFSRVCVPLFFMLSGIFALGQEYNHKKNIQRIKKFVITLVFWSIIYYLINNGFHFKNVYKTIVNSFFDAEMTSRHLWYMYPLIGLYIALPFISNMCKNLSREHENLFLYLWCGFSGLSCIILPLSELVTKTRVEITYPIPMINSAYYLGYFISGYILYNRVKDTPFDKKKTLLCICGFFASNIIMIIATFFVSIEKDKFWDAMTWYRGIFIIAATFSVFLLASANEKFFKCEKILYLSKHTFGIYLIHIVFFKIVKHYFNLLDMNPIITIPLATAFIYIVSLISCVVLSKIPILKKLIQ